LFDDKDDIAIGFYKDKTEVFMLNKQERKLIKAILGKAMSSEILKRLIAEILGSEYVDIGENLLDQIGGFQAAPAIRNDQ